MGNVDILSMALEQLLSLAQQLGQPAFRGRQIFSWLHQKRVSDFSEMSDLPAALREQLERQAYITTLKEVTRKTSGDGTVKFLFALPDGNCIETVAMSYHHGISVCVSSQVGCRMGCRFCASTQNGLVRGLSAGEILAQVYSVDRLLGQRVDSVVMMGIGEPLDNFDAAVGFYDIVTSKQGYGLSVRSVSLSTCGIVPAIYRLAELKKQLTLSVSLHAPNNRKRDEIMPVNRIYPIEQLMDACRHYAKATGRRISYEYAVIHGSNDTPEDARELSSLLKGTLAHVNLIPVNPAVRSDFTATRADAEAFRQKLLSLGVNATVRRTLGADISAACGQLRRDNIDLSTKED